MVINRVFKIYIYNMIKKYTEFINESDNDDITSPISSDDKYSEIKSEVKSMIEKTIENNGGEFESFIDKFLKNQEDTKIEGFINDSDIYDFYLKLRNDIDEILHDINYFDEVPSELNVFSLYDYIIKGTERSFFEIVKLL